MKLQAAIKYSEDDVQGAKVGRSVIFSLVKRKIENKNNINLDLGKKTGKVYVIKRYKSFYVVLIFRWIHTVLQYTKVYQIQRGITLKKNI